MNNLLEQRFDIRYTINQKYLFDIQKIYSVYTNIFSLLAMWVIPLGYFYVKMKKANLEESRDCKATIPERKVGLPSCYGQEVVIVRKLGSRL